jgi:protein-disulfide isomerase
MRKLLIKLNIFSLLLILPLQGFAAASMLHCQMMFTGKAAVSQMSSVHKIKSDGSQAMQSEKMSEHCKTMQMNIDKNIDETSNPICPHCFTCGIYSPMLLASFKPVTTQFDSRTIYSDVESHFTSFIPPGPLHPPSRL